MNRPSFDVLTEPWIPVIRRDGSRDELGILPCLERAHELQEIRHPAPIVEFGMYRLLIAFVLDAFILANCRPEDPLDLKDLIGSCHFDSSKIRDYIKHCGDAFDLFHPERPFLQTTMGATRTKPLAGMFPAAPSGTNVTHWHHDPESTMRATAQEAVQLLTTIAPFMTAGGAGLSPSINGAPAVYVLPTGRNLFETIVLNIPLRTHQDTGNGVVAWRSESTPGSERSRATTAEALTWRPRRIQLIAEASDRNGVSVREMRFEKGDSSRLDWIDASLAYRHTKEKSPPIRMRENRPLWRDAGPLLLLRDDEHGHDENKVAFQRPDVVEHAFELADAGSPLVIQIYGMRTDMKMKVFEWAKSSLSVPTSLGRFTRLGSLVQYELGLAEQAAYALRSCIRVLYPREGARNKRALGTIVDRSERKYWQHLERSFHPLMGAFAEMDPNAPDDPALIAAAAADWHQAIRILALGQFEFAAKDMDADGDALERQVRARTQLTHKLRKVLS